MKQLLIGLLALSFSYSAIAADDGLLKDFDSLSGNDVLMDRAAQLSPDIKTQVVQKRAVSRPGRFEFLAGYSDSFGGDAYTKTGMLGVAANYHFNYNWSAGVRYDNAYNELSAEGKNLIASGSVPAIDYIKNSTMGIINWYPIYGKFSLVDKAVVHFDIYALAGAGQMSLRNGNSSATTAGAGMAFWLSQHLTSRLEGRWLGYTAERVPGNKEKMNVTLGQISFGYLL